MKYIFILLFSFSHLVANAYIPTNEDEIIITLATGTSSKVLADLYEQLKDDEKNEILVADILSLLLKEGREQSDPRYFGYALALLKPYLEHKEMSHELKMHHIDILQHQHHFKKALVLLDAIKSENVSDARPYLTSAVILASMGNYAKALGECKQLIFRTSHLVSTSCITQMKSHTSKLLPSYTLLQNTYAKSLKNTDEERLWALSILSKMALRLDDKEQACEYMKEALLLNQKDYYILGMYADLLLHEGENGKVLSLLEAFTYVDALLIRLSIAQKRLGKSEAVSNIEKLRGHYKNLELRKEKAHLREQAQFEFYLEENILKAWTLAKENIKRQREQSDIDIFMQTGRTMQISTNELKHILEQESF